MMYSIKALSTMAGVNTRKKFPAFKAYTNPNGPSVYEQCQSPCSKNATQLWQYIKKIKADVNDTQLKGFRYPEECAQFWTDFESNNNRTREIFYKGWIEPQAIVSLEVGGIDKLCKFVIILKLLFRSLLKLL